TCRMSWDYRLSSRAERALGRMPMRDRERVNRALNEMKGDPFRGDTAPLRGEYQGGIRGVAWSVAHSFYRETGHRGCDRPRHPATHLNHLLTPWLLLTRQVDRCL